MQHEALQAATSEGLAQVPTWCLEWDSNPQPLVRKAMNLPCPTSICFVLSPDMVSV